MKVELSLEAVPNKAAYVSEILLKASAGAVAAVEDDHCGIFVVAKEHLRKGTKVLESTAASIALEPRHWKTYCGFCARKHRDLHLCPTCRVVACCPGCARDGKHKVECLALQSLAKLFPERVEGEGPHIESSHLLACRLLCRVGELDWDLCKTLHKARLPHSIDANVALICAQLQVPPLKTWLGNEIYKQALARVIGCSHAITDVSLPLGNQYLGRGLFLNHSFYNHRCSPNAYLSCFLALDGESQEEAGVTARLHVLCDVKEGEEICISYIPTSGLSVQERRQRLQEGYGFRCVCESCSDQVITLPDNADVESIREIQFDCNAQMIQQEETVDQNQLEHIVAMLTMTQRGMKNQEIPSCHEICIEAERLLAMAYGMLGNAKEAMDHHERFIAKATEVIELFDPIAMGSQHMEYAKLVVGDEMNRQQMLALQALDVAIGADHPFVVAKRVEFQALSSNSERKRKRAGNSMDSIR